MNNIAQEARFRQRVVKYFLKHGATAASIRFKVCRQSVYNWSAMYDGKWKRLLERSPRPHHHPSEHTAEETEMILRRCPRYKNDMTALWDILRKSGYTRKYGRQYDKGDKEMGATRDNKAFSSQVQTLRKSVISGSEGAGRCKICTF